MKTYGIKLVALALAALIAAAVPAGAEQTRPSNDDLANAAPVAEMPFGHTVDTRGTTLESGEVRPSCSSISSSAWYRFVPAETTRVIAEASASSSSVMTIYTGTGYADMNEVACRSGVNLKAPFEAEAGKTYLVQIGSLGKKRASVDFGLVPNTWRETQLTSFKQEVDVPYTKVDILTIDGSPRAGNNSMYDITIDAAGTQNSRGVLTFGLVQERLHAELVTIDHTAAVVETVISYRYDSAQRECATDSGSGSACTVHSPVKNLAWLLDDGADAELLITIRVRDNKGLGLAERTIAVPFAGQVLGII